MLPNAKWRDVWRVEILIPRDKHAGELFSVATATSTMVTLLVSINSGLDTLARLDLRLRFRFLTHIITHHTDHGE
jgi:hypothetical protein